MEKVDKDLERMSFHIPRLWDRSWAEAVESAAEPGKTIIRIQKRAAFILKDREQFQVTFARLAWLNIWSKTFSALDGVLCALAKDSIYLLRMLKRTTFELQLHLFTIIKPMVDQYERDKARLQPSPGKKKKQPQLIDLKHTQVGAFGMIAFNTIK